MDAAALTTDAAAAEDQSSGDPHVGEQGAGIVDQKRFNGLMRLANRRQTQIEERDAEIERLRAQVEEGYEEQRADYLQQPWTPPVDVVETSDEAEAGDSEADEGEGDEVDDTVYEARPGVWFPVDGDDGFVPEHPPGERIVAEVNPPRAKPVPVGQEPSLEQARAVFNRLAEAEDQRIRAALDRG